ncbi:MAG: sigma-70 region 4 domain-containing protein [Lachnospiraceae bacterium]|nr:sigma-70 region 4 domain-containing protein [Lachnospiraceae bacterium]
MTMKELSEVRRLDREIEKDRQRLEELEVEAAAPGLFQRYRNSTADAGSEEQAKQMAALRCAIMEKQVRRVQEQRRLMQIAAGMRDSYTRQLFTLRFVDGKSWEEIALLLDGTPEAVKKFFFRYVKAHPDSIQK